MSKRKVKFLQDSVDITCVTCLIAGDACCTCSFLVYFFIDDFQLFSIQEHLRVKM